MHTCNRHGSVLVLVSWVLFLLSALALAVGSRVGADVEFARRIRVRADALELARSGVERAMQELLLSTNRTELAEKPAVFSANADLGPGDFSVYHEAITRDPDGVRTNFGLMAEMSKLHLNKASQRELAGVISRWGGLPNDEADTIAGAIVECRRGPETLTTAGAAGKYSQSVQYRCRNGRFEHADELLLVREIAEREGLFRALAPHLTVYGEGCFSGESAGQVGSGPEGRQRVAFVISDRGSILSWYQY